MLLDQPDFRFREIVTEWPYDASVEVWEIINLQIILMLMRRNDDS